ncbi:hypothetical protein C8R47DRAFT_1064591 [Mycena vitilis]|nr:hypothetical protein C8R47DRAFT_1064591 [Mycena vitilis]
MAAKYLGAPQRIPDYMRSPWAFAPISGKTKLVIDSLAHWPQLVVNAAKLFEAKQSQKVIAAALEKIDLDQLHEDGPALREQLQIVVLYNDFAANFKKDGYDHMLEDWLHAQCSLCFCKVGRFDHNRHYQSLFSTA